MKMKFSMRYHEGNIDTNVLISSLVFKGFSSSVFDYSLLKDEIILSNWILNEFENKLLYKFSLSTAIVEEILGLLRDRTTMVMPIIDIPTVCSDMDDNKILQLADFVNADYIITGDNDLLILGKYKNTKIVHP